LKNCIALQIECIRVKGLGLTLKLHYERNGTPNSPMVYYKLIQRICILRAHSLHGIHKIEQKRESGDYTFDINPLGVTIVISVFIQSRNFT